MKRLTTILLTSCFCSSLYAGVLFPKPIHLTRLLENSFVGSRVTVDEYYAGNRVVSISGNMTAIADYAKGELTVIRRDRDEFTIDTFVEIARRARSGGAKLRRQTAADEWDVRRSSSPSSRKSATQYIATPRDAKGSLREAALSVSTDHLLSREAIEIIEGVAYPNEPREQQRAVMAILDAFRRGGETDTAVYALPLEQSFSFEMDGEVTVLSNRIVRVAEEQVPPEALILPERRVDSRLVDTEKLLNELESISGASADRK